MRYTTCIDITEYSLLYRNLNARLLYFHLCLKSGYHDDDRDILDISLRRLADDVGITFSALRHALKILQQHGLIRVDGSTIIVTKWVQERSITKRERKQKETRQAAADEQRRQRDAERERQDAERKRERERLEQNGLSSYILFYEKKVLEYQHGDSTVLASLRRNMKMYLSECERMNHEPLIKEI